MNAATLLLTYEEQDAAMPSHSAALSCNEACWDALCRAQAAKVLAVLGRYAMVDSKVTGMTHPACNLISADEIQRIAQEAGLTWPPKEG